MRRRYFFLIFFFFTIYISGQEKTPDFYPPLKLKPVVSGSFGELRTNHFHSGLDLTTNGKQGYRVYSSGDGFVARIKVSPTGYGKALYIQYPNGYTTVYGHLQRYSKRIDSLVRHRQYENESYAVELFFKKNEIPVKRGEVVAYSGNSGSSGGPHLHFEIRKTNLQKPVDPLLFRSDVEDNVRPRIQGLKIYPVDTNSRIEGGHKSKYMQAVFYDNQFHPKGQKTVKAYGKIGLGLQVIDYLSGSWRKCGVRSIELLVDSQRIYKSDVSTFSFAETRYVNSLVDYAEKRRTGKVIQKSFVEPNNRLSIYSSLKNSGIIDLKAGEEMDIKYVVKDASGNTSVLSFKLIGVNYPNDAPAAGGDHYLMQKIAWDKPFEFKLDGVTVKFNSKTFYTDVPFYFEVDNDSNSFLSPVYVIGNDEIPVQKYFTLEIPIPDSVEYLKNKLLIAGVTLRGKPYSVGGIAKENTISARLRGFGKFTLYFDTIAPAVRLYKAPSGLNYKGRKSVDIKISDNLSGIKKYNCYIDDRWVLFEYDSKNSKLTGYTKYFPGIGSGKKELKIVVEDSVGNKTVKRYSIHL